MPDGVPPMIANTFTALIPAILVGLIFIAVATIFSFTPYGSFTQLVYTVIVTPLNSLGGSVWSLVVLILVQMLLWFFGIHGSNVISGVITAVYLPMATANLEAYAAGKALPNIYVIHSMILLVELVVQEVLYHYVSLSYYLLNQNKIRQWGN